MKYDAGAAHKWGASGRRRRGVPFRGRLRPRAEARRLTQPGLLSTREYSLSRRARRCHAGRPRRRGPRPELVDGHRHAVPAGLAGRGLQSRQGQSEVSCECRTPPLNESPDSKNLSGLPSTRALLGQSAGPLADFDPRWEGPVSVSLLHVAEVALANDQRGRSGLIPGRRLSGTVFRCTVQR